MFSRGPPSLVGGGGVRKGRDKFDGGDMALKNPTPSELPTPWRAGVLGRILRAQTSKEETEAQHLRAAWSVVEELTNMDTIIYTDGSAEGGMASSGAGVVVYSGKEIEVLEKWSAPA